MSDIMGSAFATFLGHRKKTDKVLSFPARSSDGILSIQDLTWPPLQLPPPSKRLRYSSPASGAPQRGAPPKSLLHAKPLSIASPSYCGLTLADSSPPWDATAGERKTEEHTERGVKRDVKATSRAQRSLFLKSHELPRVPLHTATSCVSRASMVSCSHCDQSFQNEDSLQEHKKTIHHRPFSCKVTGCSASFSRQNHLSRHIRIVHNKERPFACDVPNCGSRFGSKSHLGDHKRAVHMRLRNFKCGICNASWSKRFNLEKHIRIRHLREKPFRCQLCSLSFGTRSHVTRHEAKVHKELNENN